MNNLLFDKEKSIINNITSILKENIELTKGQNDSILKLTETQENHLKVTSDLFEISKKMTDKQNR